jgi:hypothetical protein
MCDPSGQIGLRRPNAKKTSRPISGSRDCSGWLVAIPETLERIAALLDGLGARWYLFGAQAAILHGASRLSADIDVTAQLGPSELSSMVEALPRAGFASRVRNPIAFSKETRVVPLVDTASEVPVDVVLAGAGPEEEFLARAKRMKVGASQIPVIAAADLVVTKILAGRAKDLEDVAAVLQHQGTDLHLEGARRLLAQMEAALDRSDLVATLDRLSHPRTKRKARPTRKRR